MEEEKFADCDEQMWDYETPGADHVKQSPSVKENSSQNTNRRVADWIDGLASGLSSVNVSLEPTTSTAHRIQQPVQASVAVEVNNNSGTSEFLKLQEANNIVIAAYKEIMTMAFGAKTWVVGTPALGSIEEFLPMFRSSPLSGMRAEFSIASAIVPIAPESLVSIMMDVDKWASLLSHIVHRGSGHALTGILRQLSLSDHRTADDMKMVNAEFQLPTPFVPTHKLRFLRFQKEIIPYVWAIVDISDDYFHHTSSDSTCGIKCRRRPSGVIIRRHDENSEVIWIENMEVHDCLPQDNIYSIIVNSNLTFCAKRWVCTLSRKLKRRKGIYINLKIQMDHQAHVTLLHLTDCMEKVYLECVNEAPDESKWVFLSDQGARILMDIRHIHVNTLGLKNYIALTSFRVQAKPLSVFQFLVKKNMELQWPSLLDLDEPEEVIKLGTEDSYCITLHKKEIAVNESTKYYEYMLQEASRDEFCSFIISSPMTQSDVNLLLNGRQRKDFLKPSGFAIMPNGSGGLQSDASLVTIVMQKELDVPETGQAIEVMNNLIRSILKEINDLVTS